MSKTTIIIWILALVVAIMFNAFAIDRQDQEIEELRGQIELLTCETRGGVSFFYEKDNFKCLTPEEYNKFLEEPLTQ